MRTRTFAFFLAPLLGTLLIAVGCNSLKNNLDARNSMDVFSHIQAPIDKVWPSVLRVSQDLGLVVVYQTFDGKQGWIKGFTKRLDHVNLYVYRADTSSSSLCIQARTKYIPNDPAEYTDYAFAETLVKEVTAQTVPPEGQP